MTIKRNTMGRVKVGLLVALIILVFIIGVMMLSYLTIQRRESMRKSAVESTLAQPIDLPKN